MEEAENIRAVRDVDFEDEDEENNEVDDLQPEASTSSTPPKEAKKGKGKETDTYGRPFIATPTEVGAAFESIVTLRYSQPTHLSGASFIHLPKSLWPDNDAYVCLLYLFYPDRKVPRNNYNSV